jgi:hypothetical protein
MRKHFLLSAEVKRVGKETNFGLIVIYPGICLDGLRNTTEHLSQDSEYFISFLFYPVDQNTLI